jgi:Flp pilus assembly protein TadG
MSVRCRIPAGGWFPMRFWRDERGAAAAEFALILTLLAIPILNVVDLGNYVYQRMQLDNAAQVGAQAVWAAVGGSNCKTPVTVSGNCPNLSTTIGTAMQSTPLGSNVILISTNENYYCVNSSGALVFAGLVSGSRPTCNDGQAAGDYVLITANDTYTAVFAGVSVVSLLTNPIARTAWTRLN